MRMVVVGCSPTRLTATSYLPQLVSIGLVLTSDRAINWMRVVASPLSLNTASSRRLTTVSTLPRLPAGSIVRGPPSKTTVPVKGCESAQKKPAGIGSWAKLVLAKPATVIQMSTPLWMTLSPARAGEPAANAQSTTATKAERNKILVISISFPRIGIASIKKVLRTGPGEPEATEAAILERDRRLDSCEGGLEGLHLGLAGDADPDAVKMVRIAAGPWIVGIPGVVVGVAVTGVMGALSGRADGDRPRRGLVQRGVGHRRDAGEEVRGHGQHGVRRAVTVGVDPWSSLVPRLGGVGPHRVARRAEVDAVSQLAPRA